MFDWNDEDLANIIWGEPGDSDDHIVPYPVGSENYSRKKEWNQENTTVRTTDQQKAAEAKSGVNGKNLECSSNFGTSDAVSASGFGMDSWPVFSGSNASKTDQDPMGTEVSRSLDEISNNDSSRCKATRVGNDSEIFEYPSDIKQHGDLVDYGWDNIGSFDDLDRIFSNDDPLFGHVSLDNTDELWCSSKDASNSPLKSLSASGDSPKLGLSTARDHLEIKKEYVQQNEDSFSLSYGKTNDSASDSLENPLSSMKHIGYSGGRRKPLLKVQTSFCVEGTSTAGQFCLGPENVVSPTEYAHKTYQLKKLPKDQKRPEGRNAGKLTQNPYGTWSPKSTSRQYENQLQPSMVQFCPSSFCGQQRHLQAPESLQYQRITNTFAGPPSHGDFTNPYPAMSMLSNVPSGEPKKQQLLSGYEIPISSVNPVNKSENLHGKHPIMTPQEKIVKLRRRQQMRAMLAIQKQQQQFSQQVSCTNHSSLGKPFKENYIQRIDGNNAEEDISTLPLLDPKSPVEQDDSGTNPVAVDYSAEDTILYRLEDIISKLDMRIRLCIRDSLFRLAQSAMQRHYTSDMSSTNKSSRHEQENAARQEIHSHCRYAKMGDPERETNPIDRTVAHLLFHRPMELSDKVFETPESPASTKISSEHISAGSENVSSLCLSESSKQKQNFSYQGSVAPCPPTERQHIDRLKGSLCLETSEIASNTGPADGGLTQAPHKEKCPS